MSEMRFSSFLLTAVVVVMAECLQATSGRPAVESDTGVADRDNVTSSQVEGDSRGTGCIGSGCLVTVPGTKVNKHPSTGPGELGQTRTQTTPAPYYYQVEDVFIDTKKVNTITEPTSTSTLSSPDYRPHILDRLVDSTVPWLTVPNTGSVETPGETGPMIPAETAPDTRVELASRGGEDLAQQPQQHGLAPCERFSRTFMLNISGCVAQDVTVFGCRGACTSKQRPENNFHLLTPMRSRVRILSFDYVRKCKCCREKTVRLLPVELKCLTLSSHSGNKLASGQQPEATYEPRTFMVEQAMECQCRTSSCNSDW
eukprot:scpid61701/ scgid29130/ 